MRYTWLACLVAAALLLGCSDSSRGDATPLPGIPAATEAPPGSEKATPTVEQTVRPGAGARLTLDPAEGTCETVALVSGSGFAPQTQVTVYTWVGLDDLMPVASASTGVDGAFEAHVSMPQLGYCGLGLEAVFEARPEGGEDDHGGGWPRAVFRVPSKPLHLEPNRIGCNEAMRVSAAGYEPGAEVTIMVGEADPFAHNFAVVTTVTADANGDIVVELQPRLPVRCADSEQAIYASVSDSLDEPRRKAVFTVDAGR